MLLATAQTLQKFRPWVYVLACEHDTYYVGFTERLHKRLQQHFSGEGANWTKKHKPLRVLRLVEALTIKDEFAVWVWLCKQVGTARVGGYCKGLCKELGFEYQFYKTRSNRLVPKQLFA